MMTEANSNNISAKRQCLLALLPLLLVSLVVDMKLTGSRNVQAFFQSMQEIQNGVVTPKNESSAYSDDSDDEDEDDMTRNNGKQPELATSSEPLTFAQATAPDPNLTTIALQSSLQFGFRNECQAFTCFVMRAMDRNMSQILLPSITMKDAFGTNHRIPFERLFDVVHWNSYFPALPRLVTYDPVVHPQWQDWDSDNVLNFTKPYAFKGKMYNYLGCYWRYTEELEKNNITTRHPAELLILQGALRPNPDIQKDINRQRDSNTTTTAKNASSSMSYMTLHARVEPDMQVHPNCPDRKVTNLTQIFDMMHQHFADPPAERLYISINRNMLEGSGRNPQSENQIAVENLRALNQAVEQGLWNGRVAVFEKEKTTRKTSGVFGALTSFFIALQSNLFIGTEVSSYSMDLITSRFYRGDRHNYLYRPEGLVHATPQDAVRPPRFQC